MKKSILLLAALFLLSNINVKADEGMWLPMLIKRLENRDLQKMGLQLTPEELYSVNNSSLKDAIVSMGGFCTGEIVSENGLMLTNHHCGYGQIRENSSVENDYLSDGFWAMTKDEELANPGLFVRFLVRMDDVTERVLAELNDSMTEDERNAKIEEISKVIESEAIANTEHQTAEVSSFFAGNEFYIFIYETYSDVRLVGAPPTSIGKFGGDTDNWMWPRQTGDFALFRIYTAPDGSPAEYSEDNIPLKPKHHLPISLKGIEDGDFAMTFGYPGSTDRYLTSFGIEQAISKKNPTVVAIRRAKLDVLDERMASSDDLRIKYASKHASIANYWKYFIGQTEQLQRNKVADKKKQIEADFAEWANADAERKAKYGNALQLIKEGYAAKDNSVIGDRYVIEAGILGADILLFSYRMDRQLETLIKIEDAGKRQEMIDALKIQAAEFFEGYDEETDKALFAVTTKMYSENVPVAQQPEYVKEAKNKYKGNWEKFADKYYSKSIMSNLSDLTEFIENPKEKTLDKDPIVKAANDVFEIYRGSGKTNKEANDKLAKGYRLLQDGIRKMNPDEDYYPDANSTMRISFGTVEDYEPRDGVMYDYYTTLEGVMEKEDPSNDEFVVPAKLKELYISKDYGQYADEDGTLHVNFLSTNDITGGNSGSPVINGNGELIGIAFDGNWEAMSGDISFEEEVQRTISVDIRYVLFVIDKFAGAKHLVDEMTLVRSNDNAAKAKEVKRAKEQPAELPTAN